MRWLRSMTGTETFTDRMSRVVSEYGLEVATSDDESCLLFLTSRGERYEMFLMLDGDGRTVMMMFLSNIIFRRGQLPERVCAGLERMNRKMERCAFDSHDGRDGSRFVVRSSIPLNKLTPDTFVAVVEDMAPRVTGLEAFLKKDGYVR